MKPNNLFFFTIVMFLAVFPTRATFLQEEEVIDVAVSAFDCYKGGSDEIVFEIFNNGTEDIEWGGQSWIPYEEWILRIIISDEVNISKGEGVQWDVVRKGGETVLTLKDEGVLLEGSSIFVNVTGADASKLNIKVDYFEYYNYFLVDGTRALENSPLNNNDVDIFLKPEKPTVTNQMILCLNEEAPPLSAMGDFDQEWYSADDVLLETAPFPDTGQEGTILYYVAQKNGPCLSEKAEVQITVLDPTASITSADKVSCKGKELPIIEGPEAIQYTGLNIEVNYKWWKRSDTEVTSWELISNAEGPYYQPKVEGKGRYFFRRETIYLKDDKIECAAFTNNLELLVKDCYIIINPILPSRISN